MSNNDSISPIELRYRTESLYKECYSRSAGDYLPAMRQSIIERFHELRAQVLDLVRAQKKNPQWDEDELIALLRDFTILANQVNSFNTRATRRFEPVSIYLSDVFSEEATAAVEKAVMDFAASFGLEGYYSGPEEWGSWFREIFVRSKRAMTSESAEAIYVRAERALEMQTLLLPQAGVDAAQADAAAKLIESLSASPDAVIQIGSIFIVKASGVIHVRNLNQQELSTLEHSRWWLQEPKTALEALFPEDEGPSRSTRKEMPNFRERHPPEIG